MRATTIDDVLEILAGIIDDTTSREDPLGYFAALYRQVTLEVKAGIEQGLFDDGPRMSHFDAVFANAYFSAYAMFRTGGKPRGAWQFTFERSRAGDLIILQNLLLGINAHINLDLGVVVGTTFDGDALVEFHTDYNRLNGILAGLIPRVRAEVERFSPRLDELVDLGGGSAELALRFSLDVARDDAWLSAMIVSMMPGVLLSPVTDGIDRKATVLGRVIADQPEPVASIVRHIHEAESADVAAIITALDSVVQQ